MVSAYTVKLPPRIGEGVWVPWGLDKVPGEVLEVYDAHAVVEVPVQGAGGERLESVSARFRIDELEPYLQWQVVASRVGAPRSGADAASAWYVDADRNGDMAKVEVRVSGSLAAQMQGPRTPASEAQEAFETDGRSAVEKFSYRYRLPRVVVVGTHGVSELRE